MSNSPYNFDYASGGAIAFEDGGDVSTNTTTDTSSDIDWGGLFDKFVGSGGKVFGDLLKGMGDKVNTPAGALAGIAGLYSLMGGNEPSKGGWQGSINLGRKATQTPYAVPMTAAPAAAGAPLAGPGAAMVPATTPTYGAGRMGKRYFAPVTYAAEGGIMGLAAGGLRDGAFIIPADVVSHLGNGSSAAGLKFLAEKFGATPIKGDGDGMSDSIDTSIEGKQPAKVANEEAIISPEKVAALGKGDPKKGAKLLYKMMSEVRKMRTGNPKQGKQINPDKFAPGGIASFNGTTGSTVTTGAGTGAGTTTGTGVVNPVGGTPNPTTTESNLSSWAGDYVADYLSKGKALADTPYQAYMGPLTAGASGLQQKVFTGLEGAAFPGNLGQSFSSGSAYQLPSPTAPGGIAGGAGAGGPTGVAAQYMNPYLQAVLNPQLEEMRRQSEISRKNLGAKFGGAGGAGAFSAMGGGRQAIESSELERNLMQEQNKAIGEGYANAYDKAMGQFNTEQGQARTLAEMMAGAGATQRGIEAEGVTADRTQFEEERMDPFKKVEFQKSLIQGLPVGAESTSQNLSGLQNIGNTVTGIGNLYDMISKFFPA